MTRRCSTCSINYPPNVFNCHVCGDTVDALGQTEPDPDWREAVERAKAQTLQRRSTEAQVEAWRLEQLLNAGYPLDTAEQLAARPAHEIDLHHAVQLLDSCAPELAARILL